VARWTWNLSQAEVEAELQKAGVPCHIVSRPKDVYEDDQLKERGYFAPLEHPVMGRQSYEPQSSFVLTKTPRRVERPSPCLGEHNEYVFKDLLGMTDDEIAGHIEDGSITTELPGQFKVSM
jgi:crotonobetainyl-CoA:carnitine CoA-transferase CaiB-like acyl-CoA transferase